MEITKNDDVVVLYERTGLENVVWTSDKDSAGSADPPTQVRYLVWYHNAAEIFGLEPPAAAAE